MSFYRKNIGGAQQLARLLVGIAAAVLAFLFLTGPLAWLVGASGLALVLTGVVGYCPACAAVGVGR